MEEKKKWVIVKEGPVVWDDTSKENDILKDIQDAKDKIYKATGVQPNVFMVGVGSESEKH